MTTTNKEIHLINQLLSTAETIGIEKTLDVLKKAKDDNAIIYEKNVEKILNIIADYTNLSKSDIIHSKLRTEERKVALAFFCYHLKTTLCMEVKEIKKKYLPNKTTRCIYLYINLVNDIKFNEKNPSTVNKFIIQNFHSLSQQIEISINQ